MTYHDWNSVKTKLMSSMKAHVELGVHNKIHKASGRVNQNARMTSPIATCRLFLDTVLWRITEVIPFKYTNRDIV